MNAFKQLARTAATVVLCAACAPTAAPTSASSGPSGPPRLAILSPQPGETVRAPAQIRFQVRCFRLGPAPGGHLHAWAGALAASQRFELRPSQQEGIVALPDPLLSGEQTLTFQLARADHTPVENPEARVVISGVVFEGP